MASEPNQTASVDGAWFATSSSKRHQARLVREHDLLLIVKDTDGSELVRVPIGEATISDRVGSIPRRITFPDGSVFETTRNDSVDRMFASHRKAGAGFVHWLERFDSKLLVVVALVVALGFSLYRYALPILVEVAVVVTPDVVPDLMSKAALRSLDEVVFEKSELDPTLRSQIVKGFAELATKSPRGAAGHTLEFRGGGTIGPNAFALPDGTVVLTDELVALAPEDLDMILAVLAHEIGHVHHDHSLRRLYRAAGVTGLILLIGGDIGAGAEDLLIQASALLTLSYSLSHETEADRFSVELMSKAGRDPAAIARFFELLMKKFGDHGDMDFLSTHPATVARIAEARRHAMQFMGQ